MLVSRPSFRNTKKGKKARLSWSLIKHHTMETYGEWRYSSTILDLETVWKWAVSFIPGSYACLYSFARHPQASDHNPFRTCVRQSANTFSLTHPSIRFPANPRICPSTTNERLLQVLVLLKTLCCWAQTLLEEHATICLPQQCVPLVDARDMIVSEFIKLRLGCTLNWI
jgi:hypothetical protein